MTRCRPRRRLHKPVSSPLRGFPHLGLSRMSASAPRTLRFRPGCMCRMRSRTAAVVLRVRPGIPELLLSKQLVYRVSFSRARQPPNALADLPDELSIPQNFDGLVPAVVFVLADDDGNRLAVACDSEGLVPSFHRVDELAEFRLDL